MPSRSLTFLHEIHDAISKYDRMIVVFGPKYVISDYCRAEWQCALVMGKIVNPLLRIGEFTQLPPELHDLHCPDFRETAQFDEAFCETVRVLTGPVHELASLLGGVPNVPPHFQPRPGHFSRVADHLIIDEEQPVTLTGSQRVVVLHGMGGIGKSVLAAAIARSTSTRRSFDDGIYWLNVGADVAPLTIMKALGKLLDEPPQFYNDLITSKSQLAKSLENKRALLVLDDVWDVKQMEVFINALGSRCRLLVTARDEGLVEATGAHNIELEVLTAEEAATHLANWANVAIESLPPEALDLARECGYLPFALALNGAMYKHGNGTSWSQLLEALKLAELDFAEHSFKDYPYSNVLSSLKVSMDMLDRDAAEAGKRYRELVAFHVQGGIPEASIAFFWGSRGGFAARHTTKTLMQLASRNLIRLEGTPEARRVFLHALQYDYLVRESDIQELSRSLWAAYEQHCRGYWPSLAVDGYVSQYLVEHLIHDGRVGEVHRLLAMESKNSRNAWYEAHVALGDIAGYLADINSAWQITREHRQEKRRAATLALPLRYAMITASIISLARSLIGEDIIAQFENGKWTAKRVLDTIQLLSPEDQLMLVIEFIPRLQTPANVLALDTALEKLEQLPASDRLDAQVGMIVSLEGPVRERILVRTLQSLWSVRNANFKYRCLAKLWEYLPPHTKNDTIRQVFIELSSLNEDFQLCSLLGEVRWLVKWCDTDMSLSFLRLIVKAQQGLEAWRPDPAEEQIEEQIEEELMDIPPADREVYFIRLRGKQHSYYDAENDVEYTLRWVLSTLAASGRLTEMRTAAHLIANETERSLVLRAIREESGLGHIVEGRQEQNQRSLRPSCNRERLSERLVIRETIGDADSKAELMVVASAYAPALVKTGMEFTMKIADLHRRSMALHQFLEHLTQPLSQEGGKATLKVLRKLPEAGRRAEALFAVAPFLPKNLQESINREAIAAISGIQSDWSRASLIRKLLDKLRSKANLPLHFLEQTFQIAMQLDENSSLDVLSCLTPHLPIPLVEDGFKAVEMFSPSTERCVVLTKMASRLAKKYANKAFEVAKEIESDPLERATAFANLAGLAGRIGERSVNEAIRSTREVEDLYFHNAGYQLHNPRDWEGIADARDEADVLATRLTYLLIRLANAGVPRDLLKSEMGFPKSIVGHVLRINRAEKRVEAVCNLVPYCNKDLLLIIRQNLGKIKDCIDRAWALTRFLAKLPKQEEIWQETLHEALVTTRQISVLNSQVDALIGIAAHLTDGEQKRAIVANALNAALKIQDSEVRGKSLALLASIQLALPASGLFEFLAQVLDASRNRTRMDLLVDVRSSLPVVHAFGGQEAIIKVIEVVEDNWRWWP